MDPKIAIFTLTMDRLDYTKFTFNSIAENTSISYHHYIVDNGSIDGTVDFLKTKSNNIYKVIYNQENVGISAASNQALNAIGDNYDYILKIDNDCEIKEYGWLKILIEIMEYKLDKIILSPFVSGISNESQPKRYDFFEYKTHTIGLVNNLGGLCVLAPAEAYKKYRFPLNLTLHGNQDVMFSTHITNDLNWQMGYVEDLFVKHLDDTSGQHEKYPDYFKKRLIYERKFVYGENPLLSKIFKPIRRIMYISAISKAGIIDENFIIYYLKKLLFFIRKK